MKTVSIEYAHIYTNNRIGEEQKLSLEILDKVKRENEQNNISLVVMVDDYSFPDPSFDYEIFTKWLTENNHKPNKVIRESQLIPLCDEMLKLITDENLKNQVSDYVRAKKYPCSLFVATWYLVRLGNIKSELVGGVVSDSLINILPLSFKPFEDKAFEMIKSTIYSDSVNKIKNMYFEGRMLA